MCIYIYIYTHTHTYAYIHIYIIKQHSKIECAALLSDNNNSNAQMSRVKSPHLTTPHTTPHFALCPPQQRAERTLHYTTLHIPHQPTPPQLSSPHPITHTHTHYIFPPHLTTSPPHHDSHSSIALSSSGSSSSSAATALTAVPIKCSTSISMLSPTQLLMFVCVCCCCCCAPVSSTKSKSTTVRSH